jgi:hypothetical protein
MKSARTCLVSTCDAATDARHPFCAAHWRMLPGRTRSMLSISAGFRDTPVRREALARAGEWLERETSS